LFCFCGDECAYTAGGGGTGIVFLRYRIA
jgi:hypothetical protein